MRVFENRAQAGRMLAPALQAFAERDDVRVLGLPRGGVPVAYHLARALKVPLDVLVVRKLGFPGQPEFAMGAIAPGGVVLFNPEVERMLSLDSPVVAATIERERAELARREHRYRADRPPLDVRGRITIVVDDGAATGSTMRAAIQALRALGAARVVVALPTASPDACAMLRREADEVVCLDTPARFRAVGQWYQDFSQTSDDEVCRLLDAAAHSGELSA